MNTLRDLVLEQGVVDIINNYKINMEETEVETIDELKQLRDMLPTIKCMLEERIGMFLKVEKMMEALDGLFGGEPLPATTFHSEMRTSIINDIGSMAHDYYGLFHSIIMLSVESDREKELSIQEKKWKVKYFNSHKTKTKFQVSLDLENLNDFFDFNL